ncbi:MAG: hypothetical protein Q8868_03270 [Bacteroidota bacterium]|nr:hypothetical protein [Bacteroidota bacterium]
MTGKLKIGVLLDGFLIQAWQYSVIAGLRNSDHAEIKLLIVESPDSSLQPKALHRINPVIRFHEKLDNIIFGGKDSYSKEKDIRKLVDTVPGISVKKSEGGEWLFDEITLSEIRKYELDVILSFGSGTLKGEILEFPSYGVWYFPMSGKNGTAGLTAGYREVVTVEPVTQASLAIQNAWEGGDKVIESSYESTCSYSIKITRNKIFWRSSLFIFRVLAGLQRGGKNYLNALIDKNKQENEIIGLQYRLPETAEATENIFRNASITIRKMIKKIFYTDAFSWVLCFGSGKRDQVESFQDNFTGFKTIHPTKGKFWADPFVISKDGNHYIFVEEFIYRKNRAHLSVLTLDSSANLLDRQIILDKPYHLSYPFIFKYDETYFMIPESSENRTIDLYRCTYFPDRWVFMKTIMKDLKAVDTTLFFHNNKWWLFTVIDETEGISGCETELFLFYSDSPFSDHWESHPMNPVVADARKARPAGNLFISSGRIYRPSQDCSVRYGNSLNLNEIIELSETGYEEKEIYKNKPVWDKKFKGMHTFNSDHDFMIIDAYTYHRRNLLDFLR